MSSRVISGALLDRIRDSLSLSPLSEIHPAFMHMHIAQVEQLVAAGLAQEMAEMVLNAAEQAGFGELNRSRRTEEKRRAAEQDRLAGVVLRSSPDGVHAALLALQKAGAPPTATGFFISHSKAEGELTAEQLGDDLIAMSEDVRALALSFCFSAMRFDSLALVQRRASL